jgi:hypothetical protein
MKDTTDSTPAANVGGLFVVDRRRMTVRQAMDSVGYQRFMDAIFAGKPIVPKVWTDEPCPHHSRMMPNRHCRHCDGTERILEPADG